MTDLLSRLDELREWLLERRAALAPCSSRAEIDAHLATVDDACEGLQFGGERPKPYEPPGIAIAHPIPPADYKAAQEEIDQRNGGIDYDKLHAKVQAQFPKTLAALHKSELEDDARAALTALVGQLRDAGYRDKYGHPIENNIHYRDALAVLKLTGETE